MIKTQSKLPNQDQDKTSNHHSSSSTSLQSHSNQTDKIMIYKACNIASHVPKKMAATTPVEIDTRGTVGSLVRQEIEYFSKFDPGCNEFSQEHQPQDTNTASTSGGSKPKFGFVNMTLKRKKKRDGSGFIPSICSVVEVVETNRLNRIHGVSYRNLRTDSKKMQD